MWLKKLPSFNVLSKPISTYNCTSPVVHDKSVTHPCDISKMSICVDNVFIVKVCNCMKELPKGGKRLRFWVLITVQVLLLPKCDKVYLLRVYSNVGFNRLCPARCRLITLEPRRTKDVLHNKFGCTDCDRKIKELFNLLVRVL